MAKNKSKEEKKEKKDNELRNKIRKLALPIVIIAFVALLLVVLLKIYPIKIASSFEEAVSIIDEIDKSHNISFSDYERGIPYLISKPRYPNPLNTPEIDILVREYKSIIGDEAVNLFTSFRAHLAEAEKYYKLSTKTYRADIHHYGISCSNREYVVESISNINKSIDELNLSVKSITNLKQKYPQNFNFLNISENWIKLMNDSMVDFQAEIDYKITEWNKFCKNNTI